MYARFSDVLSSSLERITPHHEAYWRRTLLGQLPNLNKACVTTVCRIENKMDASPFRLYTKYSTNVSKAVSDVPLQYGRVIGDFETGGRAMDVSDD